MIAATAEVIDREIDYDELLHGNFTKIPNIYLDKIKRDLNLSPIQQAIMTVVFRETIGQYGRTKRLSARISNRQFAQEANVCERTISEHMIGLVEPGLLVILQKGTGQTTSLYAINLNYNKAAAVDRYQLNHNATPQDSDPPLPPIELPTALPPPAEEEIDAPAKAEEAPENSIKSSVEDRVEGNAPLFKEEEASSGSEDRVTKPNKDGVIVDTSLDAAKPTAAEKEKKRTKTISDVCSFFSKFFGIILTWQIVGWYVKAYGVDAVLEKLEIMRRQMGRGLKFSNPGGWFRSALKNDYAFSKWDTVKMKADEASKRGELRSLEESRRKAEEERKAEQETARCEDFKASMPELDREGLRASAIERLAAGGAVVEFIIEPSILAEENAILREAEEGLGNGSE